jgi:hypothetical protein
MSEILHRRYPLNALRNFLSAVRLQDIPERLKIPEDTVRLIYSLQCEPPLPLRRDARSSRASGYLSTR